MSLDAMLNDFGPLFQGIATPVDPSEHRAALERAKRPGQGCYRQYGERPTKSNDQKVIPHHARMGVRR